MRILLILSMLCAVIQARESRQNAVSRAIEQTKSRQRPAQSPSRHVNRKKSQNPGRQEVVDVEKMNKLLRVLDKTWVLPREGAKEPVGSNFQYKKTCSSIFKARHGACQQLGFGIMCFNYCYERGEKLSFSCEDASDAAYCRQSGTFETFLAKYRKDSYKAKAYIHQMLSRCYATAICNTQSGILNSTLIDEAEEVVERTTKINRLKQLMLRRVTKPGVETTTTEATPMAAEASEEEVQTTVKPTVVSKKRASPRPRAKGKKETETTTVSSNIWDKFTVGQKAKPTSKYIPFWQKLMSTTTKQPSTSAEKEEEETTEKQKPLATPAPEETKTEENKKEEEEEYYEYEESEEHIETTTPKRKTRKRTKSSRRKPVEKAEQNMPSEEEKHTFRPLPMTTPPPPGPELAFKPSDKSAEHGPGFLYRFQPNRWFQSIHYVTNTGK